MKDLIEKLKDKTYVRAFGLMSKEEQEIYRKAGAGNCDYYSSFNKWVSLFPKDIYYPNNTYAIKPEYQPEPEFVELEIEIQSKTRGKYCVDVLGCICTDENIFFPIDELPSLPNFEGFWTDGEFGKSPSVGLTSVATRMSEGKKVYARFRRDT